MTLPVRPCAAASARSRSSSATAWSGRSCARSTRASTRYSVSRGVAHLVVRAQAALLRPADGRREVALGQQQPSPLRGDRVEQAVTPGSGATRSASSDRVQGASVVTLGLPDPSPASPGLSASGRGVGEPAAQRDALGDVPQGIVELAPLVGHLRHAHVRDARGGQDRPPGRCGDLEGLLVGLDAPRRGALSPLDQAEVMAAHSGQSSARRPPTHLGDGSTTGALGLRQPAAQPLGHGQVAAGRWIPASTRPRASSASARRVEFDCAFGVAAELGEIGTPERDRRGDVRHQARGPADRRLERLIGELPRTRARRHPSMRLDRLQPAADEGHVRLCQRQPRPGVDQLGGQCGKPPLQRRLPRCVGAAASTCRSIIRAAHAASPAANAWRMASSAKPFRSCQAAAARCSSGTRSGCSCCSRARSRSANRW